MRPVPPQARSGSVQATNRLSLEEILSAGENCSIVGLLDALLERAHARGASDIHIDPSVEAIRVRMRIDGVLIDMEPLPRSIHQEIISRVKILTGLRTDEHQAPQDGRFRHILPDGGHVDIRVSVVPTYHGENTVMRLLTGDKANFTLASLGFSASDLAKVEHAIKKTSGMILSTGPTGSGKTTTLYTLIKVLNSSEVSVVTIEDPIEYSVENIEQIQVNARTGISFASGLRSILRQDPDIIMVGEIRDAETAGIAVNTALTGHLLLSTLHTNDAATTIPRLTDMGIDPYLVAATMNIAIGQRLVRAICADCKEEVAITSEECVSLEGLTLQKPLGPSEKVARGKGCDACGGTGYRGRMSIHEILVSDSALRDAILRKASADEIRAIAIKGGMTTMLDDGFAKVRQGGTTISEVLRVIHE